MSDQVSLAGGTPDHQVPFALLTVALQEWAAVCVALGEGRVVLTLRKGGIHEHGGELFRPEHQRFVLFPTYLHQEPAKLQPHFAHLVSTVDPSPGVHRVALWAEVAHVWKITDLATIHALGPELPWTVAEIDKRFAYRDEPWLYVMALRIHRFKTPLEMADHASYAGCRSWIPLQQPVSVAESSPVLSNGLFEIRLDRLNTVLAPGRPISRGLLGPVKRAPRSRS